ncbi:MAG: hypothetical protein IBJ11_03020 [Phycisphaerales bacterium]|nr:hypothetical protein [Phycisphaerales bacterium]
MARSSSSSLSNLSIRELQMEMRRRQRKLSTLHRKREKLITQLRTIDSVIAEHGGSIGGGGELVMRKRPKNDSKLADALVAVLTGKTMSVTDVAEAVQKAGYKTTSPNFRTIVNQTLLRESRIKRVSRGQYTAKAKG